jgi:hypothetical protein
LITTWFQPDYRLITTRALPDGQATESLRRDTANLLASSR